MADLIANLKSYLSLDTQGTNVLHEEHNSYNLLHDKRGNYGISGNSPPRRAVQSSRWWRRSGDVALALWVRSWYRDESRSCLFEKVSSRAGKAIDATFYGKYRRCRIDCLACVTNILPRRPMPAPTSYHHVSINSKRSLWGMWIRRL